MAKDYNELEQLVNDVTNIDTARMTLRWALERLNAVEKEKAELKKNLTIAEESGKGFEIKARSLQESFSSRSKTLDEKEDFYGKLEATMALLGEGKLDIQQLLKKEAKLDHLHKELENEYQDKFEDLDKSQASLIERWNQRLLGVEEQYARRLAEAQTKYDSLRNSLEADHQSRLGALEKSYQQKEKELVERIRLLEFSVKSGEGKLEGRKKELETEFIAKQKEIEDNYLRLKSILEVNLADRVRGLDAEHGEQVKSLEKSWNLERSRLLEESRIRDEQFGKAQEEIANLEEGLAAQQEKHHSELMAVISEKEQAFKNRAAELEREKAAYEAAVEQLAGKLEQKENDWVAEKEKLQTEFFRRSAEVDASVKERAASLDKEHAVRGEELKAALAAAKTGFEKDADARVEEARRAMGIEKARLAEADVRKSAALEKADAFIKDLELALSATREEHHRELMEKIRTNEEAFRKKLAGFEAEKNEYQAAIAHMAEEARAKDARAEELKAGYEAKLTDRQAEFGEKAQAFERQIGALKEEHHAELMCKMLEKEDAFRAKEAAFAEQAQELEQRISSLKEEHHAELMCKMLEKEDAFRVKEAAFAEQARELERRISSLKEEHHAELMAKMLGKEDAFKAKEAAIGADHAAREEELRKEAAEMLDTERAAWQAQVKRLEHLLGSGADDFKKAQKEISELTSRNAQLGEQLLDKEAGYNREMVEVKANYEKELNLRVKDMVEVQTAHLLEALESAKGRNEEAAGTIQDRDGEIERLKSDMAEQARQFEERLMTTESLAISGKIAELEAAYKAKKERLDAETAGLKGALEKEYRGMHAEMAKDFEIRNRQLVTENETLRGLVEGLRREIYEVSMKAESFFSDMMERKRAHQDELKKLNEDHLTELHVRTTEAVAKASEALVEKLYFAEEGLVKMQRDHMDEMRSMQDGFLKEKERLVEDLTRRESCIEAGDIKIAQLENEITRCKADSAIELRTRLVEQEEKFNILAKEYEARQDKADKETQEKFSAVRASYEARLKRAEEESAASLAKVTESLSDRIYSAEEGMLRLQKDHMDELRSMQDGFLKEKERLVEDLSRRESCIETGDLKIAALENELMKFRQDSAAVLMNNLAEQEDKFNAVLREYHDRMAKNEKEAAEKLEHTKKGYEARLKELEGDLQAKDAQLRVDSEAWNKKTREQDAEYSGRVLGQLAEQEDRFNALLKDYHARQEKLDRDASARLELIKSSYDTKLAEMDAMLQSKEAMMRESEELCSRKQMELDARQTGMNADLYDRERKLSKKEKDLNDRHLELERDYSVKTAEIEKLRIELVRVITDYKNKK